MECRDLQRPAGYWQPCGEAELYGNSPGHARDGVSVINAGGGTAELYGVFSRRIADAIPALKAGAGRAVSVVSRLWNRDGKLLREEHVASGEAEAHAHPLGRTPGGFSVPRAGLGETTSSR